MTREQSAAPADGSVPVDGLQPIGSARATIAAAAVFLTLFCVVLAFIAGVNNGLMVLATVFFAVTVVALGAHRLTYWVAFWKSLS